LLKIKSLFDRFIDTITIGLLIIMILSSFAQVIARYVFSSPFSWTEEVAVYTLVWATFLGAAIAIRRNDHLGVDFFVGFFPEKFQKILEGLLSLVIIVILCVIVAKGIDLVEMVQNQRSAALRLSMAYFYSAVPIGAAIMLLEYVWNLCTSFTKREVH
jgi:TRAP-type C4-dicarboxylate transport system permease small subunit